MGYFVYAFVEIAGRGYTHWTMCLTGGIVLTLLYIMNKSRTMTLIKSCITGALMITAIEFAVGVFDNIIMGWSVWDYSGLRFNFMGQICPLFTTIWSILCIPAFYLCRIIRRRFD
ncbi:MAG: putative ABC transporter permease [Ruminococcus sp.]|nr:putative ABC transporter permease [Ruminococcus sp.]